MAMGNQASATATDNGVTVDFMPPVSVRRFPKLKRDKQKGSILVERQFSVPTSDSAVGIAHV
jgi:hypothetical protein